MSRFLSYTFPAGNTTDICQLQTVVNGSNFIINGNLAAGGQVSFNNLYSRNISFTSVGNNSTVRFTITGMQNGVPITELTNANAGPNNNTVYSTQIYDSVTSIVPSIANANNVSIGTGWNGFFPLVGINLDRDVINYTLTVASLTGNANTIALYGTLENIVQNGSTYLNTITNDYNVFAIRSAVADQFVYSNAYAGAGITTINPIYSSILVQVGTAGATTGYNMQMILRQT